MGIRVKTHQKNAYKLHLLWVNDLIEEQSTWGFWEIFSHFKKDMSKLLWTELWFPKFTCWSPDPDVTEFGDRVYKEAIKVNSEKDRH